MLAIAWVISNRVKSGMHDGDWLKVLANAPLQASSTLEEMSSFDQPDLWEPDFRWLTTQCEDIYDGKGVNPTFSMDAPTHSVANPSKPSFFYCNPSLPIRQWFLDRVINDKENHPRTVEVQPVVFFG